MDVAVRVDGLSRLRRDIRRVDPTLVPLLRTNLKRAGDAVVSSARSRVPVRSGAAKESIRVTSGGNVIYIKGGKAKVPYYGWLDFGGVLKPSGGRRNRQSRPKLRHGRYIYPAIAANKLAIARGVERAVNDALRRTGL